MIYLGSKWPGNWASGANIQHTSKSSSNCHVHQGWCETTGKFCEKDQRLEFWLILGPKVSKKWPSEAHILHTSKSTCNEHVKQYWCETSENFLRKWPHTSILNYFGAQKGPHIVHISESSSNERIKQDWCESRASFLTEYSKTWIFTHLEVQKFGPLEPIVYKPTKVAPMSL